MDLSSDPKDEFEHTLMEATYRSKCAACGEWIEEGDRIGLNTDKEWIHADCYDD